MKTNGQIVMAVSARTSSPQPRFAAYPLGAARALVGRP